MELYRADKYMHHLTKGNIVYYHMPPDTVHSIDIFDRLQHIVLKYSVLRFHTYEKKIKLKPGDGWNSAIHCSSDVSTQAPVLSRL